MRASAYRCRQEGERFRNIAAHSSGTSERAIADGVDEEHRNITKAFTTYQWRSQKLPGVSHICCTEPPSLSCTH